MSDQAGGVRQLPCARSPPLFPLTAPCRPLPPRARPDGHHPAREERRAAAPGKRKVCAAQSDAKILKELFGGGYLEIRPCEGPRVQIRQLGRSARTGSGRYPPPVPRRREGRPASESPGPASPQTPWQVGPLSLLFLTHTSFQNSVPLCLLRHRRRRVCVCAVGSWPLLQPSGPQSARRER